MTLSRRHPHPLHRERFRTALQCLRAADAWLHQRERVNDLRLRHLHNGDAARDVCQAALDRLYEVRESQPLFSTYQEKGVMAGLLMCARQAESIDDDQADALGAERQADCDCVEAPPLMPVFPPGVENIRQTPRRPGAPATPAG